MYIRPWLLFGKERMCIYVLGSHLATCYRTVCLESQVNPKPHPNCRPLRLHFIFPVIKPLKFYLFGHTLLL